MKTPRGFTIVEFMVSIVIGLIILSGVIRVMANSRAQQMLSEETSYLQENARFALDTMSKDIRMAGYVGGCRVMGHTMNAVTDATANDSGFHSPAGFKGGLLLRGWEVSTDAGYPANFTAPVAATDAIVIERGEPQDSILVDSHNGTVFTLHAPATTQVQAGDILAAASSTCDQASIFKMVGPAGSPVGTIVNSGVGNCVASLGGDGNCNNTTNLTAGYTFPRGTMIMQFRSTGYYITPGVTGVNSLFRQDTMRVADRRELVTGVEDMQLLYGVDTHTDPSYVNMTLRSDGRPDTYVTATILNATPNMWRYVVAVKVTLVLRTIGDMLSANTAMTLQVNGAPKTYPSDRKLRVAVSQIVQLRNQGS